jgi:multiple sugar transport system substrate-binding protein
MKSVLEKYWWTFILLIIVFLAFYLAKDDPQKYLEFATWGTLEELESYSRLADRYNSQNPPYPVRLIHISGEYEQKLLVMAAAKNTPDVIKGFNGLLRSFYRNGIIADLTPFIQSDPEFDLDHYYPSLVKMGQIDSRQIAIPIVFSTLVLYYNKNHFDMAGIPYPDSTWAWDDFLRAAKRLTKYDKSGQIVRCGGFIEAFRPILVLQWGGHQFNTTRDSSIMASENSAESLKFFLDLFQKHCVSYDPAVKGFRMDEIFSSERTSMVINGRWATPWFVKTMREGAFDVAPVPHKKQRMTGLAAHYIVMCSTSKKKTAAWDFMKYLVSYEAQKLTSEDGNNIPAMKSVAESDLFLKNTNTPNINNQVFLDELPYAVEWMFEECAYISQSLMLRRFDMLREKASTGLLTPIQAMQDYDEALNRVIALAKQKKVPQAFVGSALFFTCVAIVLIPVGIMIRKFL